MTFTIISGAIKANSRGDSGVRAIYVGRLFEGLRLKTRFEINMNRHKGLEWAQV